MISSRWHLMCSFNWFLFLSLTVWTKTQWNQKLLIITLFLAADSYESYFILKVLFLLTNSWSLCGLSSQCSVWKPWVWQEGCNPTGFISYSDRMETLQLQKALKHFTLTGIKAHGCRSESEHRSTSNSTPSPSDSARSSPLYLSTSYFISVHTLRALERWNCDVEMQ